MVKVLVKVLNQLRRNLPLFVYSLTAFTGYLFTNVANSWSWKEEWAVSFRSAFASDQLSYLAIVTESSNGFSTSIEPFSRTGSMYYPHLYYKFLGETSNFFGVNPVAAWNYIGIAVQASFVLVLAIYIFWATKKRWLIATSFIPIMVGTLSWFQQSDWQTLLDSHAVLWGPFATLFVMNGEVFGLFMAFFGLLMTGLGIFYLRLNKKYAVLWLVLGSLAIGITGSIQTYAYISSTYLLMYGIAFYGLSTSSNRKSVYLTIALLLAIPIVGDSLSRIAGNTVALLAGLVPVIPGLFLALRKNQKLIYVPVFYSVAAAPQLFLVATGLQKQDEFLMFRQASSAALGVNFSSGMISSIPGFLIWLSAFIYLRQNGSKDAAWTLGSIPIVWLILSTNNTWGAVQEPYRFWIELNFFIIMLSFPWFLLFLLESNKHRNKIQMSSAWIIIVVVSLSCFDWYKFQLGPPTAPPTQIINSPEMRSIGQMGIDKNDFVMTDTCVDTKSLKASTGARILDFNRGMAWPANYDSFVELMNLRDTGVVSIELMAELGVNKIVIDNRCPQKLTGLPTLESGKNQINGDITIISMSNS